MKSILRGDYFPRTNIIIEVQFFHFYWEKMTGATGKSLRSALQALHVIHGILFPDENN